MSEKIEKNKEYIIEIDGMGYQGEGVGKVDGFTIFIQGAIQGEKVKVKVIKVNKNFAFGKLLEVLEPSPYRANPLCSIYKRCGGCQLQHMSYEGQLDFKKKRVKDCLERIGKFEVEEQDRIFKDNVLEKSSEDTSVKLYNTLGMTNPYRYRNKVQLPVGKCNQKINIGFYAKASHEIIDMESCLIQDETSDKIVKFMRDWIEKYNIEPYDEKTGRGTIKHIMTRKGFATGEIMLVIVTFTETCLIKRTCRTYV